MFKKIFMAAVIFLITSQFNACDASMPRSEMYLGNFTVGSSYLEMVKMYGEPVQDEQHIEDNYTCRYGDSVTISYNKYAKKIQSVVVSANNGWNTPSGLAVGMNISRALDIYGEPNYKKSGSIKTAYCYFNKSGNQPDFGFVILFNKESGKILKMGLYGGNTMVSFDEVYQNIVDRMLE